MQRRITRCISTRALCSTLTESHPQPCSVREEKPKTVQVWKTFTKGASTSTRAPSLMPIKQNTKTILETQSAQNITSRCWTRRNRAFRNSQVLWARGLSNHEIRVNIKKRKNYWERRRFLKPRWVFWILYIQKLLWKQNLTGNWIEHIQNLVKIFNWLLLNSPICPSKLKSKLKTKRTFIWQLKI